MILSDRDLRMELAGGGLVITPAPHMQAIQPASIDLRLGDSFRKVRGPKWTQRDPLPLPPGGFLLGSTVEWVEIGAHLVGQLDGKSTQARLGVSIHQTAGWIDPGFRGVITLELLNVSGEVAVLTPGMLIGQLVVMRLSSPAERPYGSSGLGSHYMGQTGATPAAVS